MMRSKKKRKKISEEKTVRLQYDESQSLINEDVIIGSSSIIGTRETQQDMYSTRKYTENKFWYAVLCDGMGGIEGGAIASKTATDYITEQLDRFKTCELNDDDLIRVVTSANDKILNISDEDGICMRAGTTMAFVVIKDGALKWCSVGDSKIYLFKNGMFQCLTNEHNYGFMVEQKLGDSNFKFNPSVRSDALVSYLGAAKLEYIDIHHRQIALDDDDMVVLCSDGLYKVLNEDDIVIQLLSEDKDMQKVANNLTESSKMKALGSQDNTTVVVLKYKNEMF